MQALAARVALVAALALVALVGAGAAWRLRRSEPVLGPVSPAAAWTAHAAGFLLWTMGAVILYESLLRELPAAGDAGGWWAPAAGAALLAVGLVLVREGLRALRGQAARAGRLGRAEP